jgi:hypothetical protein
VAKSAVGFLAGTLHPGFFNYPSLFLYLVGLLDALFCGAATLTGRFDSLAACGASWHMDAEPFFLTGRLASACAGTASIPLVYGLARRFFDEGTSLGGAALLAVAFLHVRDSHFGVTDVAMTALLLLALQLLIRAHDTQKPRHLAIAALVSGLAVSTKYSAALLAAPFALSLVLSWRQTAPAGIGVRVLVFGLGMALGFVAGTPYAVVDPVRFWSDASYEATHLTTGHGITLGIGWRHHLEVNLRHGLTMPILLAGFGGALWIIRRMPARAALFLAFPLTYYAVAGRGYTVFARYMMPVVPFICVLAAYAVVHGSQWLVRRVPRLRDVPVTILAASIVAVPSVWKSWQFDRLLTRTDSRVLAAAWLAANVPAKATIYQTGSHYGRPDLTQRGEPPNLSVLRYDEAARVFRTDGGQPVERPDWLVVQEHPLTLYSRVPDVIQAMLPHYDLRQVFSAIDMQAWHVFDQQDAWFVPLAGFAGVSRPGPNLSVYSRRD